VFKNKLVRQNRLCYVPKEVADPTLNLPPLSDQEVTDDYPLDNDFKLVNLNVHMLGSLLEDSEATEVYFSSLLEQFMVDRNLIDFTQAKHLQAKLLKKNNYSN
jgi:hypothetical protein